MRETTIRERLDETRAELERVEAEYRILLDLTRAYERWLTILGLPFEPAVAMRAERPAEQASVSASVAVASALSTSTRSCLTRPSARTTSSSSFRYSASSLRES